MGKQSGFKVILFLWVLVISCNVGSAADGNSAIKTQGSSPVSIYCNENNNLYQLLLSSGYALERYSDIGEALDRAPAGQVLLVLAKGYPTEKTLLPKDFYQRAKEKKLKVYVEFPDHLESGRTGAITATEKERLVVTSDNFGKGTE